MIKTTAVNNGGLWPPFIYRFPADCHVPGVPAVTHTHSLGLSTAGAEFMHLEPLGQVKVVGGAVSYKTGNAVPCLTKLPSHAGTVATSHLQPEL